MNETSSGLTRTQVPVLVLPDIDACRRLAPHLDADTAHDALLADPQVRPGVPVPAERVCPAECRHSNRIARMAFLTVPPSLDAGEITDKGSINQRAVLRHRAAVVDALYATPAPSWAVAVDDSGP
jgi:feruloyl-CoA synthase